MAYRQPKVPQAAKGANAEETLRALIRFLKDDCMASWNADRRKDEEIERIKRKLDALEREE